MTPGTAFTLYDLVTLMIIQSDNTATNMIIDVVGVKNIQQIMMEMGLEKSKFYHKLMTVPVDREGINQVTAGEMSLMLEKLAMGQIISLHACEQMIAILKKQQIRHALPSKIPEQDEAIIGSLTEFELAHKTGNVTGICHDIGIFYVGRRKLVASFLSEGLEEITARNVFGELGLTIYQALRDSQ